MHIFNTDCIISLAALSIRKRLEKGDAQSSLFADKALKKLTKVVSSCVF